MLKTPFGIFIGLVLLLSGFTNKSENEVLADELKKSPERIIIGKHELVLKAYIFHSSMPIIGNDTCSTTSRNTLTDGNKFEIRHSFQLIKQYIVSDTSVWTLKYHSEDFPSIICIEKTSCIPGKYYLPLMMKEVDVVCEFKDLRTDSIYRIMNKNIRMH